VGEDGKVTAIECVRAEMVRGADGRTTIEPVAGSEFQIKADMVLLAMGFVGPKTDGLVEQSGVDLDPRGNVKAAMGDYQTSVPRVFSCGDMRRGQSLVVWAIREGRECAEAVDRYLAGHPRGAQPAGMVAA